MTNPQIIEEIQMLRELDRITAARVARQREFLSRGKNLRSVNWLK